MIITNIRKSLVSFFLVMLLFVNPVGAKTLKFAQLTDIHFSPEGKNESSRDVSYSAKNLMFAINSINKQDVSFAVFLGDNIDKSRPENLLAFLRTTQSLKIPYYLVIGNHDSYKLTGIPKEDYVKAIKLYNQNVKSDKPYYYFCPNKDVIAIVVDGATTFAPSTHGLYTPEMLNWLDNVLTKNQDKIALIFQHFPLIPPEDNYSHTTLYPDKYLELLIKHKNIALISSGHFHSDKVTIDENGIYHISVPSLLAKPSIYEVVEINYEKQRFQNPTDVKININRIPI